MSVEIGNCKYWNIICKDYFQSDKTYCEYISVFCILYWDLKDSENKKQPELPLEEDSD